VLRHCLLFGTYLLWLISDLCHGALLSYPRCLPLVQVSHLRKALAEVSPSPAVVRCAWFLVGLQSKAEIWVSPSVCPRTMVQRQNPPALHSLFPASWIPQMKQRLCKTVSLLYVCCFKPVSNREMNLFRSQAWRASFRKRENGGCCKKSVQQ